MDNLQKLIDIEEIKNLKERLVKVRTETRIDMGMEIDEWKKVAEGS